MIEKTTNHITALAKMFETRKRRLLFISFITCFILFDFLDMRFGSLLPIWGELLGTIGFSGVAIFLGVNIIKYIPGDYRWRGLYRLGAISFIIIGVGSIGTFLWKIIALINNGLGA